ncbi:Acid phosphatase-like protein 2 [Borealophlyctis nickersoniae]|nr:Acid phosphatase-like protein 2 [Borealophlyctis nickersoniae]
MASLTTTLLVAIVAYLAATFSIPSQLVAYIFPKATVTNVSQPTSTTPSGSEPNWTVLAHLNPDPRPYNYCFAPLPEPATYEKVPNARLQSLQIISRHGDRSPSIALPHENVAWAECTGPEEFMYLADRKSEAGDGLGRVFAREMKIPEGIRGYWDGNCNLGQLTERGVRQMWLLGERLRKVYLEGGVDWVGDGEGPNAPGVDKLTVRSTDVWRTMQAAQSLVSALYPQSDPQTPPIPIHVQPKPIDALSVSLARCPRLQHIFRTARRDTPHENITPANAFFKQLDISLGHPNFTVGERYFDIFACRQCHNKPLPCSPVTTTSSTPYCVPPEAAAAVIEYAHWWGLYEYDPTRVEEARLKVGPLLLELISHFFGDGGGAVYYYSAHDTTISALLGVLRGDDRRWPPYASSLVWEVWRPDEGGEDQGEHLLRLIYNGDVVRVPWCQARDPRDGCTVTAFMEYIEKFLPVDMEKECEERRE